MTEHRTKGLQAEADLTMARDHLRAITAAEQEPTEAPIVHLTPRRHEHR